MITNFEWVDTDRVDTSRHTPDVFVKYHDGRIYSGVRRGNGRTDLFDYTGGKEKRVDGVRTQPNAGWKWTIGYNAGSYGNEYTMETVPGV